MPYSNLIGAQGLSISAWINLGSISSFYGYSIITNHFPSSTQFAFALGGTNDGANHRKLVFFFNSFSGGSQAIYCPVIPIIVNQWTHVACTVKSDTVNFYVDGALIHVQSVVFDSLSTEGPAPDVKIGQGNPTSGFRQDWNGFLDDIGIWNRALTPQEISDLYNAVNCANNLSISPAQNSVQRGNSATFTATTSDPNPTIIWQSDFGQGFQTLNNVGNYSGSNTASLNIANVQLNNHNQPVRAISTSGNCVDTSALSVINVLDTCVTTVFDTITTFISVTDTLIINAIISSVNPPNNMNTLLIYPNPANTHITIDNGNFASMSGYTVRINNALGQVVFNQNITQQHFFIDLSTWTGPGLYYFNLLDPNGNPIEVKKIVIQ